MNGASQPPAGLTKAGGCFGSLLYRRTLGLPTDAVEGVTLLLCPLKK